MITNARYADDTRTIILAEIDGAAWCIPVDLANRHYQEIIAAGLTVADPL